MGQPLWAFQAPKSINTLLAQVSYHLQPGESWVPFSVCSAWLCLGSAFHSVLPSLRLCSLELQMPQEVGVSLSARGQQLA